MYCDCIKCNHCGKIYRFYSCGMPKYCHKCGDQITSFSGNTTSIKNATKIVAKRTLFGWRERKAKERI